MRWVTADLLVTVDVEVDDTLGDEALHDEVERVAVLAIQRGEGWGRLDHWSFGPKGAA